MHIQMFGIFYKLIELTLFIFCLINRFVIAISITRFVLYIVDINIRTIVGQRKKKNEHDIDSRSRITCY